MNKTYQQENNEILRMAIEKDWKPCLQNPDKQYTEENMGIELYITPECNQKCSYCYLCAHGDEIYPKELRNKEQILHNYKLFINYCIENKFKPGHFDLFSGEIWESDFGIEILEYLATTLETQQDFMPKIVMIPSNCSFVFNETYRPKIENILERINNNSKIPTRLVFSCSNDGYIIDKDTRPYNDPKKYPYEKSDPKYYDILFEFCKKWGFAFHPMVSAHCIEKWQENYQWWIDKLIEYDLEPMRWIMLLETRNDNWTEDKIIHYLKYLNFSIDYLIKHVMPKYNVNSIEAYRKYINGDLNRSFNKYNSLRLTKRKSWLCCSLPRTLTVRLGDLAIVPCHRTSYEQFIIGHFVIENDKIVGVKANNIQMMNQVWYNNQLGSAKCSSCAYSIFCTEGCYGSQYENTGDLFYPCSTVCNLFKARIIFLYHKYKKLGLMKDANLLHSNTQMMNLLSQIEKTEEYDKWTKISLEIL